MNPGDFPLGCCPSCGAVERKPAWRHARVRLFRCARCQLMYSDPQPRGGVTERYLNHYDLAEYFQGWESRKSVLYEWRLAQLPAARPGANRLCDVGCADGQFLEVARPRGWDLHGVELNPPAAQRSRERGVTVTEGLLEDSDDLEWGSFDLVTSWDVIEHTPTPREFAERLYRLVAPGGTVALTTLNSSSLAGRVFRQHWSMVAEDHFTYWDLHSLPDLVSRSGLRVEKATTYGLGRDFVKWVDRLVARRQAAGVASPTVAAPPTGTASPSSRRWDASRSVLAGERALNRFLRATDLGVGQLVVATKPRA